MSQERKKPEWVKCVESRDSDDYSYVDGTPAVIDFGSHRTKASSADYDEPETIFPPVFARYIGTRFLGADTPDYCYGDEAVMKSSVIGLDYLHWMTPIDQTPWDDDGFERMIDHTIFREARVYTEESPILLTSLHRTWMKKKSSGRLKLPKTLQEGP